MDAQGQQALGRGEGKLLDCRRVAWRFADRGVGWQLATRGDPQVWRWGQMAVWGRRGKTSFGDGG